MSNQETLLRELDEIEKQGKETDCWNLEQSARERRRAVKIAEKYGGEDVVIVGDVTHGTTNFRDLKIILRVEETVCESDGSTFGTRIYDDIFLSAKTPEGIATLSKAYRLSDIAVADRKTHELIAFTNDYTD